MAARTVELASIGHDEQTGGPICTLTLTYDDVTLKVAAVRVVNHSDDTAASAIVVDLSRPIGHAQRERTFTASPGLDRSFSVASANIIGAMSEDGAFVLPQYELRFGGSTRKTLVR